MESSDVKKLVEESFRVLMENSKDMMFIKDADLIYRAASVPFVKMVGKETVEQVVGKKDADIFDDKSLARRYVADDKKLIKGGQNLVDYIEPIPEENGQARYGSTSKYLLHDENNKVIGILGVTRDITRDYIARQHYQQELRYLFGLPKDTYAVCFVDIDEWRVISQRRQVIENGNMQECQTVEELVKFAKESIVDSNCGAAVFYNNFNPDFLREIYDTGRNNMSFRYQRRVGENMVRWVHNDIRFIIDVDSQHLCAMLSAKDIDEEKREEQKLVTAAKMDKMTMLYNRETTMDSISRILRDEPESNHVLFMIDVDNFKTLNDTRGHQAGDEFLIDLASEIKHSFRETDIVGRIGGDEFFALMRNVPGDSITLRKAQELLDTIQEVCEDYTDLNLSSSIGISMYPQDGTTLEELYAQADGALYEAKRKGKNRYVFAKK
ncbi:MAG: GGDEF domain-containing protein [Lachnospiraceae bacterium]|nr:GGDEF domain-containing protein [Lachnospiraceae bacterium]